MGEAYTICPRWPGGGVKAKLWPAFQWLIYLACGIYIYNDFRNLAWTIVKAWLRMDNVAR